MLNDADYDLSRDDAGPPPDDAGLALDDSGFFEDSPAGDAFDTAPLAFDTVPLGLLASDPGLDLPAPPRRRRQSQAVSVASEGPTPPADLPVERALCGCCLLDSSCVPLALTHCKAEDFHDPRHQAVFESITRLATLDRTTDAVSVLTDLEMNGKSGQVGLAYLLELTELVGSTLSVEHYARRIAKLGKVRRLLRATHTVNAAGYKPGLDPDEFVNLVETELGAALREGNREGAVPIGEIVGTVWSEMMKARDRGGEIVGISTGFRDLDRLLHGLHRTDLIILAARPAMGKTALALNLGLEVARKERDRPEKPGERNGVLIFSLEMGREQLVQRLLSSRSRVPLSSIRTGQLATDDEILLREAAAELSELRVFIDDMAGMSMVDVRARAKRMAMSGPVDLIIVDYLQLMRGTGGAKQSREQEISEISRGLKGLAKEMQCTVLALSQLNRAVEGRADKRPMMADLRESGAIEQDADIISFVYRDHVYNKDAPEHDAELIIVKHRAGETGTVLMHFDGKFVRFSNRDHQMDDRYAGVG